MDIRAASSSDPPVRFIAVIGASGSGKSSIAHGLVQRLGSPFLPLSLDSFFSPDACEALGTYEDCRTIDYDRLCEALLTLRRTVEAAAKEVWTMPRISWHATLRSHLPDSLLPYLIPESSNEGDEYPGHDGAVPGSLDGTSSADVSLHAHEAEELQLRLSTTQCYREKNWGSAVTVPGAELERVITVVCEGFALLCAPPHHSIHLLFDRCVWLKCGFERCCLRRFIRTPRRHARHLNYRERILTLWSTRTAARRTSLLNFLTEDLKAPECSQATARDGFYPPLPPVGVPSTGGPAGDALARAVTDDTYHAALWDARTELPSGVFCTLWANLFCEGTVPPCEEVTADCDGQHGPSMPSPCEMPRWDAATAATVLQHLYKAKKGCGEEGIGEPSLAEQDQLLHAYCEFRYWYMYEVLYYHCVFEGCQLLRCAEHSIPVTIIHNEGGDVSTLSDAVETALDALRSPDE